MLLPAVASSLVVLKRHRPPDINDAAIKHYLWRFGQNVSTDHLISMIVPPLVLFQTGEIWCEVEVTPGRPYVVVNVEVFNAIGLPLVDRKFPLVRYATLNRCLLDITGLFCRALFACIPGAARPWQDQGYPTLDLQVDSSRSVLS